MSPDAEHTPGDWLRRPELRVALGMWAILAVVVSVKILVAPDKHTLFPKFAAGAAHWWSRQPLYARHEALGTFRGSPPFAIAMTPFALLGVRAGGVLWSWVSMGVFVWGARRLVRDVLPGDWPPNREMVFLILSLVGAFAGVWNSQNSPLAAGLLMGACSGLSRRNAWGCAALLAAVVAIHFPLIVVVLLLAIAWPRQLAVRLPMTMALMAAVPFLAAPPTVALESYRGWYGYVAAASTQRGPGLRDAWTVWEFIAGTVNVQAYRVVQMLAGAAVLIWCVWLRRLADDRMRLTLVLAVGVAALMLFGPTVERATYAIVAPIMAWAIIESVDRRVLRWLTLPGSALILLFGAGVVQRTLQAHAPAAAALPTGTALITTWLVLYTRRCRRRSPDAQAD